MEHVSAMECVCVRWSACRGREAGGVQEVYLHGEQLRARRHAVDHAVVVQVERARRASDQRLHRAASPRPQQRGRAIPEVEMQLM